MNGFIIERVEIEKLAFPVDGYIYNAKVFRSVDNGKTFWYCGTGKYFKNLQDAEKFRTDYGARKEN